jgi:glycine/sarcosine N-methyltransferase
MELYVEYDLFLTLVNDKKEKTVYDQFVELYDFIFPLKQIQREFVLRHCKTRDRLLDIGCSTGVLSASLASEFSETIAIDYSSEMVAKASEREEEVTYLQGDMRTLSSTFSSTMTGAFDAITCFGNTLVHLDSVNEVGEFFKSVQKQLTNEGVFLFQILNYESILRDRPKALPTIDNESITFTRLYHYDSLPHIRFETKLYDKNKNETVTGEVPLLAIEPDNIRTLLLESGFSTVSFFGTFDDNLFTKESFPLIVKASM